jgi:phosphoglucosamine mutase
MEEDIEQLLDMDFPRPNGVKIGKVKVLPDAYELYVDYLIDQVGIRLDGLRVVLDCAYGAAYKVAPLVYRSLGADVISINDIPLGEKINVNCGSTYPGIIREEIRKYPGSIGISFDGDSDRVVLVDEEGNILDGDSILAIWSIELFKREKLRNNTVVGTILSNMGLEIALLKYGIRLIRSDVGDRYVLEEMFKSNAVIGGEPSGHIIYLPGVTTGDGIYTSLMVLKILKETGRTLSSFKDIMIRYPQISRNIKVKDKIGILEDMRMKNLREYLKVTLAGRGRFIIRPSGTEPYLRIMLEGEDEEYLDRLMEEITGKVREIDNAYL